jgi:hypothetical protein
MIDPTVASRIPPPPLGRAAQEVAPETPPPAVSAPEVITQLNPLMRIDPALGIVVLEFRDRAGDISDSIPTQRELKAYHDAAQAGVTPEAPQSRESTPEGSADLTL